MQTRLCYLTAAQARERMNRYGREARKFFFMTDFEARRCVVEEPARLPEDEIRFAFPSVAHGCTALQTSRPEHFEWKVFPQAYESYRRSFDVVRRNIYAGNSFLANLTCATPVRTDLSLLQVFEHARAPYRLWLKGRFTVFSPEIFVRIRDGRIYSYPMKGTADAGVPHAAEILLADPKEAAEHATITDLIRNDLSRFARGVEVDRYRYLDEVPTHRGRLLQMSSEISGRLPGGYAEHLGDMLFGMLPAGSISGAPKRKTVEIIREAETYERGFYTGVMGYFDGETLDSAVMIRFLEQDGDRFIFKSGGGITFQSRARDEYEEMISKIYVPIY